MSRTRRIFLIFVALTAIVSFPLNALVQWRLMTHGLITSGDILSSRSIVSRSGGPVYYHQVRYVVDGTPYERELSSGSTSMSGVMSIRYLPELPSVAVESSFDTRLSLSGFLIGMAAVGLFSMIGLMAAMSARQPPR